MIFVWIFLECVWNLQPPHSYPKSSVDFLHSCFQQSVANYNLHQVKRNWKN